MRFLSPLPPGRAPSQTTSSLLAMTSPEPAMCRHVSYTTVYQLQLLKRGDPQHIPPFWTIPLFNFQLQPKYCTCCCTDPSHNWQRCKQEPGTDSHPRGQQSKTGTKATVWWCFCAFSPGPSLLFHAIIHIWYDFLSKIHRGNINITGRGSCGSVGKAAVRFPVQAACCDVEVSLSKTAKL